MAAMGTGNMRHGESDVAAPLYGAARSVVTAAGARQTPPKIAIEDRRKNTVGSGSLKSAHLRRAAKCTFKCGD